MLPKWRNFAKTGRTEPTKVHIKLCLIIILDKSISSDNKTLGGSGQVVSELAFYSDGPSSIPAATYILYVNLFLKKRK